jgi:outer membrane protein
MRCVPRKPLLMAISILAAASAASSAQAQTRSSDWQVRVGGAWINTDTSNDNLVFEGIELNNFRANVGNKAGPVFNVTWFATPNIGIELLAAAPFKHGISGRGELSGLDLGSTKHLPPTLSVQYHFLPHSELRPYVGAGVNYTIFSSESVASGVHEALIATANGATGSDFAGGSTRMSIKDSYGLSFQAGVDLHFNKRWFVNFDARWISIDADARLKSRTTSASTGDTTLRSNLDLSIDPWVYSATIGYRF